jgi:hypothetical protein
VLLVDVVPEPLLVDGMSEQVLVVVVVVVVQGLPDASVPSLSNFEHSTQGLPCWSLPSVSALEHSMIDEQVDGALVEVEVVDVDALELLELELVDGVSQSTGGGTEVPPPL